MAIFSPSLPTADLHTQSMDGDVVVTYFRGHITQQLAHERLPAFESAIQDTPGATWIMELTTMTGFDPGAVTAGGSWWQVFKKHHGKEILLVSTQAAARMAAASLSFSIGLSVKTFSTLNPALAYAGIRLPRENGGSGANR